MGKQSWKSQRCQKLVRHYVARKPAALSGKTRVMTKPRFIAGMLLVTHGAAAYAAFCAIQKQCDQGWPESAGALLKQALNDELREEHGELTCKFCERRATNDEDLLDWMTTQTQAWWACPACTAAQGLNEGDETSESS
ncbi:MAG: hypothetical protein JRD89_03070 [Deltaproteobacteria bacterium]|nr:hypothetical protein [Deltaproteobacteria bacterium]